MSRNLGSFQTLLLVAGTSLVTLSGCSGAPGRVDPPDYAPEAGGAAVGMYDSDNDEVIGSSELSSVPGPRASLRQVDRNEDQVLTAEEIDERVSDWKKSRVAEMNVMCQVTLDGAPLANANVVLEPESFLGTSVQSGSGTTAVDGMTTVSMPKEYLADPRYLGMACGWYKIRVTSDTDEIPAKYNTDTTLGCEVAVNAHWTLAGVITLALESE